MFVRVGDYVQECAGLCMLPLSHRKAGASSEGTLVAVFAKERSFFQRLSIGKMNIEKNQEMPATALQPQPQPQKKGVLPSLSLRSPNRESGSNGGANT